MKFFRHYDGTRETYRIDYDSFISTFNYLSPEEERLLRSRYAKLPKYIPQVKRLNTTEIGGYTPIIKNY